MRPASRFRDSGENQNFNCKDHILSLSELEHQNKHNQKPNIQKKIKYLTLTSENFRSR